MSYPLFLAHRILPKKRRIVKPLMHHLCISGKNRAVFMGPVANSDHVIEFHPPKPLQGLRSMFRYIHPRLRHHLNGHAIQSMRPNSRRAHVHRRRPQMPREALRHLTPARITGTEKKNSNLPPRPHQTCSSSMPCGTPRPITLPIPIRSIRRRPVQQ